MATAEFDQIDELHNDLRKDLRRLEDDRGAIESNMQELNRVADAIDDSPEIQEEQHQDAMRVLQLRDEARRAYKKIEGNMRELEKVENDLEDVARMAEVEGGVGYLADARRLAARGERLYKLIGTAYDTIDTNERSMPGSITGKW